MKKRRMMALFMAAAMAVTGLAGCSSSGDAAATPAAEKTEAPAGNADTKAAADTTAAATEGRCV